MGRAALRHHGQPGGLAGTAEAGRTPRSFARPGNRQRLVCCGSRTMAETRRTRKAASHGWPKRGEIHLTALDPAVGHEIGKTRPALVIQNATSNRYGAVTMVAPVTSTDRKS